MAIIKKNELKKMNRDQLIDKLNELKRELMKVNAQKSGGSAPENPGMVREVKKTIARIKSMEVKK